MFHVKQLPTPHCSTTAPGNRSSTTHRPHNRPSPGSNPLPPSNIVSQRNIWHLCFRRAHPQTRNHASSATQRPLSHQRGATLGSTPLNHPRTPTPRAFPQSRTTPNTRSAHPDAAPHAHTRSARSDLPPQSPAGIPADQLTPRLAQPPREDPVPRREDPCEYEARGTRTIVAPGARPSTTRYRPMIAPRRPAGEPGSSWCPAGRNRRRAVGCKYQQSEVTSTLADRLHGDHDAPKPRRHAKGDPASTCTPAPPARSSRVTATMSAPGTA